MEELISKIISIEGNAKAITERAYYEKDHLQKEMEQELEQYQNHILQQEKKRKEELTICMMQQMEEQRKQSLQRHQFMLKQIDEKWEKNKENWEEGLLHSIIQ